MVDKVEEVQRQGVQRAEVHVPTVSAGFVGLFGAKPHGMALVDNGYVEDDASLAAAAIIAPSGAVTGRRDGGGGRSSNTVTAAATTNAAAAAIATRHGGVGG